MCKSPQEPLPAGGIAFPALETGHRTGPGSVPSNLLHAPSHGPQTQPQRASNSGSQHFEPFPEGQAFQNGNTSVHLYRLGRG